MQAQGLVVVRADPLGGIDRARLQRREDFTGRQVDHGAAHFGQHFAAQTRGAHFQAVEVINRVDFLVKPTSGLHAGVATGHRQHTKRLVHLFPQLKTAAAVQPGVHFLGIGAKWRSTEELRRRHFAFPVIRGAVAHFSGATGDGIKHLKRGHQLTGGIDLDLQTAVAHLINQLGKTLGTHPDTGEVFRPGGHHFPVEGLATRALLGLTSRIGFLLATGQGRGGKTDTCCCEDLTTFHAKLLLLL